MHKYQLFLFLLSFLLWYFTPILSDCLETLINMVKCLSAVYKTLTRPKIQIVYSVKYVHERIHLFFMKFSEFGLWWNTETTVNIPSSFLLTQKGAKDSVVCSLKKCRLGIFGWSGHRRRAFTVYLENRELLPRKAIFGLGDEKQMCSCKDVVGETIQSPRFGASLPFGACMGCSHRKISQAVALLWGTLTLKMSPIKLIPQTAWGVTGPAHLHCISPSSFLTSVFLLLLFIAW